MSTSNRDEREHALELRLERETAVLLDRLDAQAAELERMGIELHAKASDCERARVRIAELEAELSELVLALARANENLARAEAARHLLLTSVSWRVTRPLRWAKRIPR